MNKKKLDEWLVLFHDADGKRTEVTTEITNRRRDQYLGTGTRYKSDGTAYKKLAEVTRKIAYEMIETQVDNSIPYPKVTERDSKHKAGANIIELHLKNEIERIQMGRINDWIDRDTKIQGTSVLLVDWDNSQHTHLTTGELVVKGYPVEDVWVQPGVTDPDDAEYIFTRDIVSSSKIKKIYGVLPPEDPALKGMCELYTAYYYSDRGYLSKFGWVKDTIIFDEEDYELRKIRACKTCGESVPEGNICPKCGALSFEYKELEKEVLTDDLVNIETGEVVPKGTAIDWYYMQEMPFVFRLNTSNGKSLYGLSDVDVVAKHQDALSRVLSKEFENVMKGGSIVTKPAGVTIPNNDETLKSVTIDDPALKASFGVFPVQASIQQEAILATTLYGVARDELGITDSYQGKRDPTAESGKAKEISAAQASTRLESKRKMKSEAFSDLYEKMFKILLANCDEPRTIAIHNIDGTITDARFHRYLFLDKDKNGKLFYNDRFIFGTDNASMLTTNREAMWQENLNNLKNGAYGNPQDPTVLRLYWSQMKELGYPFSESVLSTLNLMIQAQQQAVQQAGGSNETSSKQ